jgi:hypothetical protein
MDCMSALGRVGENGGIGFGGVPNVGGGRGEEIFDRKVGGGEFGDNAAAIEHQRAMANLGNLLEICGHDQNGGSGLKSHVE